MVTIDIEIKDRSRIKDFFHKVHSRLEDVAFSIVQKLPDKFIPRWLMDWLERYLNKRIDELKQQTIKMTWHNMHLQNSLDAIHNRQQNAEKAPSEE